MSANKKISWGMGGGWGGGGVGGGGQYFITLWKLFRFPCISIENEQFYPNLWFNYISFGKIVFESLEVHCNVNDTIYWNFFFHHFVGKFTLLLSESDSYWSVSEVFCINNLDQVIWLAEN